MKLFLCCGCGRHVKGGTSDCPFCGAAVSTEACVDSARPSRRMSRGALLAGGAAVAFVASCSSASYGQCPTEVSLTSPCGITLVETTCLGGLPACASADGSVFTSCSVVPTTDQCTISVMLGDGTQHTVPVDGKGCVSPGFVDFASSTCVPPRASDGGPVADATNDRSD